MTALASASNICKRQTPPLVREGVPYQQIRNYLKKETNVYTWAPDGRKSRGAWCQDELIGGNPPVVKKLRH
jgi:hypothetical protein